MGEINRSNDQTEIQDVPGLAVSGGKKVILVRHGKTEWNKLFRYQGVTNIPLCQEGEDQARRVALRLSCISVQRIISSPLKRSLRTAEIIAEAAGGADVEVWDDLIEVNFGEWEGLTVQEIKAKFGADTFNKWKNAQLDVQVPSGEDSEDLYRRASNTAKRIISLADEYTIIVGHGAMFRALLLPLIGMRKDSIFWRMRIDNCSLSGVEIDKKGRVSITFLNDTLHLRTEMAFIREIPLPW